MTKFYIAEGDAGTPVETNAKTIAAAKRAAARAQVFQGTSLYVLTKNASGQFNTVSAKHPDAINRNIKGSWRDL